MKLPEVNSERWMSCKNLRGEKWAQIPIKAKRAFYCSNYGRVKIEGYQLKLLGWRDEQIVHQIMGGYGYYRVSIDGRSHFVHRLVAMTFLPNPEEKPFVDHINAIRTDNRLANLRWATCAENANNPLNRNKLKFPPILGGEALEKLRQEMAECGVTLIEYKPRSAKK